MDDTIDGVASDPGVTDPIQQRADDVRYPTWQPECRAVMLEIVPIRIQEKLAAAEAAMAERLPQIMTSEGYPERRALLSEAKALNLALDAIRRQYPTLDT
jgi:hypothetical protein